MPWMEVEEDARGLCEGTSLCFFLSLLVGGAASLTGTVDAGRVDLSVAWRVCPPVGYVLSLERSGLCVDWVCCA